jgi:hypothetical protein
MQTAIQDKFRSIDLPLRLAESPREFSRRILDREASTLFMIDIRTRRGRIRPQEYVLLYCGEKTTTRVIDVDRRHRQVLLDVHEPSSRLTTVRWDGKRSLRVEEEIIVKASQRRILVGMDESQLFICPLEKRASSVKEAHRKLAPEEVDRARHSLKVKRQGEWFFVPVRNSDKLRQIGEACAAGEFSSDAPITAAGRPHRVEQLVEIDYERYSMGKVRHPDHRTLRLESWHRVFRNTEEVMVRPTGVTWEMTCVD